MWGARGSVRDAESERSDDLEGSFGDEDGSKESGGYETGIMEEQFGNKLAILTRFFAEKFIDDILMGPVELNKLLFLTDAWAYGHLGHSVTGLDYVHREEGPSLEGGIADYGHLSPEETEIAEKVCEQFRGLERDKIKDWLHDFLGWQYTAEGEKIPYFSIFLWKKRPLCEECLAWAMQTPSVRNALL